MLVKCLTDEAMAFAMHGICTAQSPCIIVNVACMHCSLQPSLVILQIANVVLFYSTVLHDQ